MFFYLVVLFLALCIYLVKNPGFSDGVVIVYVLVLCSELHMQNVSAVL